MRAHNSFTNSKIQSSKFKNVFKTKKEAGMKKVIVIMLALFLAVPAITYAGSATSRYDVTIGGFVKFDMGYATKGTGADTTVAPRESYHRNQNQNDEYGNFFAASGATTLNLLVKGPDGWGAKTSAFIEADFQGKWNGTANYGVATLRHAWMRFDWGKSKLTIGQQWQAFGMVPTYGGVLMGDDDLAPFMKGNRQPQIVFNQDLNKNFAYMIGLMSPSAAMGTAGGASRVDGYTRSGIPFVEGELTYTTDSCGKIGPWQMLFGIGGFFGTEKRSAVSQVAAVGVPQRFADENVNSWAVILKGFIPIIPEKKGNKAGALSLSGAGFIGQNISWLSGPGGASWSTTSGNSYQRTGNVNTGWAATPIVGTWGQMSYWFTNAVAINGFYGYGSSSVSSAWRAQRNGTANNDVVNLQHCIVNLTYDVNPAVRLGVEWANIYTRYSGYQRLGVTDQFYGSKGTVNMFRVGAYYFF